MLKQDYPQDRFEVIIINDGANDNTEEYLKELAQNNSRIKYQTIINGGTSVARNTGFKMAQGEIIASTDDDCVADASWLMTIASTFRQYPNAAAVGGSIFNSADSDFSWAMHMLCFSKWFCSGRIRCVKDIPTCNIAYRRDSIRNMAFIEDDNGPYYRDALFNYELVRAGNTIIFNPDIRIYHFKDFKGLTIKDFIENQRMYSIGFVYGGYRVHGLLGHVLIKYRYLNLSCLRLFLVFLRCLVSPEVAGRFIALLPLLIKGEWARNSEILKELKKN